MSRLKALKTFSGTVILSLCIVGSSTEAIGQSLGTDKLYDAILDVDDSSFGFTSGSFIVAPIPFRNPTIGTGLAAVGGYLFKMDENSDTSILGLGAFRSDNGSLGYGLSASLNFDANRWKLSFLAAKSDLYYDLGDTSQTIPIRQEAPFTQLGFQYQFTPDWYIGAKASYMETNISLDGDNRIPLPPAVGQDNRIRIPQAALTIQHLTLDDTIFPTRGTDTLLTLGGGDVRNRDDGRFSKGVLIADYFTPAFSEDVLAFELALCGVDSSTPFFLSCSLGGTDNMRGFSPTQNIGKNLVSFQAEYRGRISEHFGYVVFLGAGKIGSPLPLVAGASSSSNYAGGVGARIRLSSKYKVDFSVDYAVNNQSQDTVYIYVGQAF